MKTTNKETAKQTRAWAKSKGVKPVREKREKEAPVLKEIEADETVCIKQNKYGGEFDLPCGGKLSVPEGVFSRKDTVTCSVISPANRWRTCPPLAGDEHLVSEVFLLSSSCATLKRCLVLQLPWYQADLKFNKIQVRAKWCNETDWINADFLSKVDDNEKAFVELKIFEMGTFVVTYLSKTDVFRITPNGGMYSARLSRYIGVRLPRKAIDCNLQLTLMITPIPKDGLESCKAKFKHDCADLDCVSEFIDIISDVKCNFRRPATVRLPLPSTSHITTEISILVKTENHKWHLIETRYKFTRTCVSVDVKEFGRFCVVKSNPELKSSISNALSVLEHQLFTIPGEILVFLSVEEKLWKMGVELCFQPQAEKKAAKWIDRKFVRMEKVMKTEPQNKQFRRSITAREQPLKVKEDLRIEDKLQWTAQVDGAIQISKYDENSHDQNFRFFDRLPENYQVLTVEPCTSDPQILTAETLISFNRFGENVSISKFTIKIQEESVRDYLYVEPVPVQSVPIRPVPVQSVPIRPVPVQSIPIGPVPVQSIPIGPVPVQSVPIGPVPVQSVPIGPVPVQSVPIEPVPVQSVPFEPVPVQSVPFEPVPVQSVPFEPVPVQSVPFEPVPVQSVPFELVPVQSVPMEPVPIKPKVIDSEISAKKISKIPVHHKLSVKNIQIQRSKASETIIRRLSRVVRKSTNVDKEPRVLTGKSLMCLSQIVPNGLRLATYLQVPESSLSGLAYDAMAQRLSMADMTYKILLYWKRRQTMRKHTVVQTLVAALSEMGCHNVATIVAQRHTDNLELTTDCFAEDNTSQLTEGIHWLHINRDINFQPADCENIGTLIGCR